MKKEDKEIILTVIRILLNPGSTMLLDHKKLLEYYNKNKDLDKAAKEHKKSKKGDDKK